MKDVERVANRDRFIAHVPKSIHRAGVERTN